uniref:Uncharacterized protein n=1 Tax=Daphnia magna TaxID=35525 RepID=A0A0P6JC59_9CRUS
MKTGCATCFVVVVRRSMTHFPLNRACQTAKSSSHWTRVLIRFLKTFKTRKFSLACYLSKRVYNLVCRFYFKP